MNENSIFEFKFQDIFICVQQRRYDYRTLGVHEKIFLSIIKESRWSNIFAHLNKNAR
jgi:hypothetical protein